MEGKGRKITANKMSSRREFLKLAGAAGILPVGLLAGCRGQTTTSGPEEETLEGQQEAGSDASRGRLLARPSPPSEATVSTGLQPLGLGSERDGLLYIPESYRARQEAPLALMLHGAGGNARGGLSHFLELADETYLILLAPESRGRTWDVLIDGYGPDVEFIDRALEQTFDRLAVDTGSLAVSGFSDGASYALSLGLTNGDLFTDVIAFSPGFMRPAARRGKPSVFVSHGTRDEVLPIGKTSREIVPRLERDGYEVRYQEFKGGHTVPPEIRREALNWFIPQHN